MMIYIDSFGMVDGGHILGRSFAYVFKDSSLISKGLDIGALLLNYLDE